MLAFTRTDGDETVLCVFNAGDEAETRKLELSGKLTTLLGRARESVGEEGRALMLYPRSGAVFRVD